MSVLKQIFGAMLVLLVAAAGLFAYEHMTSGRAAVGPAGGGQAGGAPVELAVAEIRRAERRVEAVGSTMARRAIEIVPQASGHITELNFEPGQALSQGDPVVHLDEDIERANLMEAEAALKEAELALERARTLRESRTVTQATLEQLISQEASARAALNRAERRLSDRIVRAPFDGIVGLKRVDAGARVTDSTVITTLDDRSEMEIEFSLPETLYGQVKAGQPVTATSSAFSGQSFQGVVATIDSRIDQTSRSFKVRARLPNPDLVLPAGMFMHLSVVLDERDAIQIPEEAIIAEGNQTFVFVARDGKAMRRPVRLGQRDVGRVEILEGLEPGERVVVQGALRLRDGAEISVVGEPPEGGEAVPVAEAGPA